MSNNPNSVSLTVNANNTYSFSGGNQGNGNVNFSKGQGQGVINITLNAPSGYTIQSVDFEGTGSDNFSYHITQNGGGAVIQDTCLDLADVAYTVNVVSGSTSIPCHPMIKNIP